jgi:hypothetical protein
VLIGTEQKTSFDRWFPSVEAQSGKPDCVEPQRIFVTDQKLSVETLARGLWDGVSHRVNLSEGRRRRRKKKSLHHSPGGGILQAHH